MRVEVLPKSGTVCEAGNSLWSLFSGGHSSKNRNRVNFTKTGQTVATVEILIKTPPFQIRVCLCLFWPDETSGTFTWYFYMVGVERTTFFTLIAYRD